MTELETRYAYTDLERITFGKMQNRHRHNAKVYDYALIRLFDGTIVKFPEWTEGYGLLKNYVSGTTLCVKWHVVKSNKGHIYNDGLSVELMGKEGK